MKSLRALGYVAVGMIITDVNGKEMIVTGIVIPSRNKKVQTAIIPKDNDLILELNFKHYLHTDIGWSKLDSRIRVKNGKDFSHPVH